MLVTSTALASVFGLPLGRMIGQTFGWRLTFAVIGVAALVLLAMLAMLVKVMPRVTSEQSGSVKSQPGLLGNRTLLSLYVLAIVVVTAHFCAFPYIEPFVQQVAGLNQNVAALLMLVMGLAGIAGSILFSRFGENYLPHLLTGAIASLLVCLAALLPLAHHTYLLVGVCLVSGMAIMIVGMGMQMKVLTFVPDATDIGMSLFSGIFNIGIGLGALARKTVSIEFSTASIGYAGALFALCALTLAMLILRRWSSNVSVGEQTIGG